MHLLRYVVTANVIWKKQTTSHLKYSKKVAFTPCNIYCIAVLVCKRHCHNMRLMRKYDRFECIFHNRPNEYKHCPNEVETNRKQFHATSITLCATVPLHTFRDGFSGWIGQHPNTDDLQDI